ncbi:hypothetical protein C1I95_33040 [Micromonospora craterilacus]|uniref:Uncharacterized protein n=1 Tax=Micromonospora craterilacus TaxID=1655439 RepID=A0A2W2EJF6_9ACTN|nr:hypothetical protein [Micromonospora craterilacus]PZG04854.1 hypothetical protein C1I95_33040 [Micromonospora craterilacus]
MTADVVELTERSTEQAARARADRIRQGLRDYLETVQEFALAFERCDWQVLGYPTWQDYLDGEYGADRLRVPEVHRRAAVATLRQVGMSTRAIGAALGVSKDTAAREVATVAAETDDLPATVRSLDGRERPATRPARSTPVVIEERGPEPGEHVWIAIARKGIQGHGLKTKTSTRCSRSTLNGLTLPAEQARERHAAVWCRTCWPEEATRFAAGESEAHDPRASDTVGAERRDSAPTDQPDPLAGVGADYEPDPARRIAAVAEVAPEYVRPVERHPETATPGPGHTNASPPVDGADTDAVVPALADPAEDVPVGHAAPAPVPPAASLTGGTGVPPAPLTLTQVGRIRAALAHLKACGGARVEERVYEVWYSSAAPALGGSQPVRLASVQWWPDGELHIRFLEYAGRYCKASTEFYAADVDQVLDMLCALRLLPAHLSTAHAAGVQAGMRAGDAIDGAIEEADHG